MFAKGWRSRREAANKRADQKRKMASHREQRSAHYAQQALLAKGVDAVALEEVAPPSEAIEPAAVVIAETVPSIEESEAVVTEDAQPKKGRKMKPGGLNRVSYITAADLSTSYGPAILAKITGTPANGTPDPALIQRGIDSADGIIDAYLSARYTLPLVNVPDIIIECATDIAIYKIALQRAQRTDEMRVRYDDALKMLAGISSGSIGLGLSPAQLSGNGDAEDPRTKLARSVNTYLA